MISKKQTHRGHYCNYYFYYYRCAGSIRVIVLSMDKPEPPDSLMSLQTQTRPGRESDVSQNNYIPLIFYIIFYYYYI